MLGVPQARRSVTRMSRAARAASASSTSRGCCRAASARCCSPTSAPTCSRSRTPAWATTSAGRRRTTRGRRAGARHPLGAVPGAEPQQALDPPRPEGRGRARGAAAPGRATTTSCSSPSAPACSTASASATSACARRTRGSSTARSPATGRTGPPRPLRPRHELPRPDRAARADRRGRRPAVQAAGQIADLGGGALMAAFGILAALRERERSGEGQLVDVSMADGALSWLAMVAGALPRRRRRAAPRRRASSPGALVCYRPYEAADGWVTLGALEPKFWARFCAGVGREDLIEKQFERAGSRGLGGGRGDLPLADARASGGRSTPSTTAASSRSSTSTRRSTPSSCARARWSSSRSSRRSGRCASSASR